MLPPRTRSSGQAVPSGRLASMVPPALAPGPRCWHCQRSTLSRWGQATLSRPRNAQSPTSRPLVDRAACPHLHPGRVPLGASASPAPPGPRPRRLRHAPPLAVQALLPRRSLCARAACVAFAAALFAQFPRRLRRRRAAHAVPPTLAPGPRCCPIGPARSLHGSPCARAGAALPDGLLRGDVHASRRHSQEHGLPDALPQSRIPAGPPSGRPFTASSE